MGTALRVNGCCLTVVARRSIRGRTVLSFDLLSGNMEPDQPLLGGNGARGQSGAISRGGCAFGRSLRDRPRDDTGTITRWEREGRTMSWKWWRQSPSDRSCCSKGRLRWTASGLTVAAVTGTGFRVWIIPHTREVTALADRAVGTVMNLGADLLGRSTSRACCPKSRRAAASAGRRGSTNRFDGWICRPEREWYVRHP